MNNIGLVPFPDFELKLNILFILAFFNLNSNAKYENFNIAFSYGQYVVSVNHRDKTRVKTPAKKFTHLNLLYWLFMGSTFGFAT
jgi:hypothetical protein